MSRSKIYLKNIEQQFIQNVIQQIYCMHCNPQVFIPAYLTQNQNWVFFFTHRLRLDPALSCFDILKVKYVLIKLCQAK